MLFSYENRKNKFPINFSSPLLRPSNTWNFTSGSIQNRAWWESGDSGLWRQYRTAIFADFSMAQYFSFAKEENMVQRCVAFGCSNTKDEIKGISIHQIPFYGDTWSEAVKRRGKWISFLNGNRKHWTPSKYSVGSELKRLKRVEIGVLPVSQFYRPNVEQRFDRRLHRRSVRFISPLIQWLHHLHLLYIHPKTVQGTILLFLPYGVRTLLC